MNKQSSFAAVLLLGSFLLWSSLLWSADPETPDTVGAGNWTPATAETRQRTARADQLNKIHAARGHQAALEAQRLQDERETGYGAIPHAPPDAHRLMQEDQLRQLTALQLQAESQGVSFEAIGDEMNMLLEEPLGISTNMILRTPAQGPVTGGGFAYAFEPGTKAYLGYSAIGAAGEIALPVSPGSEIDIMVFANPPFAFQVVRGVTAAEGLDVMMENAVELAVNVKDLDENILGVVATSVRFTLKSYLRYSWPAGSVSGTGSVFVAPGEVYDALAEPEIPYLADSLIDISSLEPSLEFRLEQGVALTLEFSDPMGLIGPGGCSSDGSLRLYRSLDVIKNRAYQLSVPTAVRDGSSNLIGFIAAVPDNEAIDYEVRFNTGGNFCSIEDFRQRFAWFAGDNSKDISLKPRPLPNVMLKTPGNVDIPYSYGFFYAEDGIEQAQYFTPSSPASLIAGNSYAVNVRTAGAYSVNEGFVTAQAGAFDVLLESQLLTVIKSQVTIGSANSVSALIEFYQGSVLVEAFEYDGRELTIEIPAGTYDVRVSGLTARWHNSSTADDYSVFLKPFIVEKTFIGTGDERMDFALALPGTGISFALPWDGTSYQFTVLDGLLPVASQTVYYWYDGILTDFDQLDLIIRGPGYHDQAVSADPLDSLPFIDIAGLQGTVGRLQGTLTDSEDQALVGMSITQYSEDGVFSWSLGTTDPGGQFDLPKIKNALFVFQAPDGGDSKMHFREAGDPVVSDNAVIKLTDLGFQTVTEGGEPLQLLYGTGNKGYQIVFLAEGYTALRETFTDSNANQVWDGALFIDIDGDGSWDPADGEPFQSYGERVVDWNSEAGTDITLGNEAFTDLNSDGYPNINDFAVFVQNAKNYIRSLLGTPDIAANIDFDAYTLFLPSQQAGMDVIDESEVKLIDTNTLFDVAWLLNRSLLSIDYTAAAATLDAHAPDRDLQVVMINQPVRAGRANSYILAYGGVGNSTPNNLVSGHEFGHNPGSLADEYNEFSGTSTNYFPPSRGHITHRTVTDDLPWAAYIAGRSDLPISMPHSSGDGVYAGGSYNAGGAYRSTSNSRMRYNAPLFNTISRDVFSRSLCMQSLTADDLKGTNQGGGEVPTGTIFADGFEVQGGSGVITGLCE
jgi:hypothetical protein